MYVIINYFFIQISFWGNAVPAVIALLLCAIQKRFSVQVTPKKPLFTYSILVLMLNCKFLPLSGI